MKAFFSVLILLMISVASACPVPPTSNPNDLGSKVMANKLNGFFQCNPADPANDKSPCNTFVGRAMFEVYNIKDFNTENGYLSANEMASKLAAGFNGWKVIGGLFNDDNGACVQSLANKGYPVVAALWAQPHGHVAIVLPGTFSTSGTWGAIAPNSASFRLGSVAQSYVGKPLSNAFGKDSAAKSVYYYREINPFK